MTKRNDAPVATMGWGLPEPMTLCFSPFLNRKLTDVEQRCRNRLCEEFSKHTGPGFDDCMLSMSALDMIVVAVLDEAAK